MKLALAIAAVLAGACLLAAAALAVWGFAHAEDGSLVAAGYAALCAPLPVLLVVAGNLLFHASLAAARSANTAAVAAGDRLEAARDRRSAESVRRAREAATKSAEAAAAAPAPVEAPPSPAPATVSAVAPYGYPGSPTPPYPQGYPAPAFAPPAAVQNGSRAAVLVLCGIGLPMMLAGVGFCTICLYVIGVPLIAVGGLLMILGAVMRPTKSGFAFGFSQQPQPQPQPVIVYMTAPPGSYPTPSPGLLSPPHSTVHTDIEAPPLPTDGIAK